MTLSTCEGTGKGEEKERQGAEVAKGRGRRGILNVGFWILNGL
jgi:hypothetical protein